MPSSTKVGLSSSASNFTMAKNISNLSMDVFSKMESKVTAPRNPKLVRTTEANRVKMVPSTYMKEMKMNTEQKLADTHDMRLPRVVELMDMSETTHQKVSYVDIEEAMFQPFPSEMFFQTFEPFQTYELPLLLRNNDKVPRLVKVVQHDSPYFKIISPDDVSHKVAPGMASIFRIQFTPEAKKDYTHELICMTEREKFVVPVHAIGARAILDFPDEINFGVCPVKHNTSKVLFVRNIGNREARCTFLVHHPFTASVDNGCLAVGDSMQVNVEFNPRKVGDHRQDLVVKYDTGEDVYVALYGAAVDANVRLDKNTLRIDNTYIFMANQRTVTIHNRSDVLAHYKWSPFATQQDEDTQKQKFCVEVSDEERLERERFLNECIEDPTLRDRLSILTRTFANRRNLVKDDPLLFHDDVYTLEPVEGDIWPNSSTEVTIVFKPTEARSYQQTIFCDVTGRESRLPLKVRGDGMGPKLVFSFDSIDIGNIFASSIHSYEAVLINKGDIDAIFCLVPPQDGAQRSRFHEFHFDPIEGIVLPGGHQAVAITFRSELLGSFSEEFSFSVDGSPDTISLVITGNVIGPTFHFDVPRLRFGNVSYGFNHSKVCSLVNTSLVPMTFVFRVPGDGTGEPSISCVNDLGDSLLSQMGSFTRVTSPHEFDVVPAQGTIRPQSEIRIQVTLCSNTLKRYDCALVVDVKGVGKEILSLPITAKCVVPNVQVAVPALDFGRCFINHPYMLDARLVNDTDLAAKYELLPQIREELTTLVYGSSLPRGLIEPRSTVDVPLLIQAQDVDEQEVTAHFSIFGSPEPPLSLQLSCIGEGPVVHVTPVNLDWGQTEVLVPNVKVIELSNESSIPADFIAQMMRPDSVWFVEPNRGTVPPESVLILNVTAMLDDCIRFHDKLTISVVKGPIVTIPVHGYGFGTTIVSEPPLTPSVNLGPHFAKVKCVRRFKLTNRGRRHQSLTWSTDGYVKPKSKREPCAPNLKDMKYRNLSLPPSPPEPVFQLHPTRFALESGQSMMVTLEGQCDIPKQVCENLLCHAIIGKANGKERIMRAQIRADFISPVLQLSKERIEFRVDKRPDDVTALTPQTRTFVAKNVSSLPLTCILRVKYPFQLLDFYGSPRSVLEVNLAMGQELELTVRFDPAFKDDLASRVAEGEVNITYREHPHSDAVQLKGEVNFPNLHFDKTNIDFGCILNDTEVARYLDITNTSPLPVSYRWSFLVTEGEQNIRYIGEIMQPTMPAEVAIEESAPIGPVDPSSDVAATADATSGPQASEAAPVSNADVTGSSNGPNPDQTGSSNPSADQAVPSGPYADQIASSSPNEPSGKSPEEAEMAHGADEESVIKVGESADQQDDSAQEGTIDLGISVEWSKEDGTHQDDVADDVIEEERRRAVSRLSSRHQPSHPINSRIADLPLLPWLEPGASHVPNGVEEVFDILPLYGALEPGETQRVTFTYYGHADVACNAKAICEVQGGPKYEVTLQGEASLIEYKFDKSEVDFEKQMFDQVGVCELKLENTGRVGFDFVGLAGLSPKEVVPGVPVMVPSSGHVAPFSEVVLRVHYLPGVPEKFHKSFEIQVAHFEPSIINVKGEGIFSRISLDLPRFTDDDERYVSLLKEARENLDRDTVKRDDPSRASTPERQEKENEYETSPQFVVNVDMASELDIQMEVERLLLRDFATDNQHFFSSGINLPTVSTGATPKKRKKFPRVRLTDYLLDFGFVVLGNVRSHIVRATNTSHFPVSFSTDKSSIFHSGFNVELDRVKQLPGSPDHETVDFKVTFDPRGANLDIGPVETVVPINIVGGPQICIRLRAHVAVPDLSVSSDSIDFEAVQCGQCKVVTIQLLNDQQVRCDWTSINPNSKHDVIDKHIPMHLRRKFRKDNRSKPNYFDVMPAQGSLSPGQRMNVQIKFMPTEERIYSQRMIIHIAQATSRVSIAVKGEGHEPRLDFDPNLVEFGPVLPHSTGDEVEVIVRNPTPSAVEFYSLNFDKQYLFEEKILRLMKGFDEHGNLLLPPRLAGEELPPELLQFYQDYEEKIEMSKTKIEFDGIKSEADDVTEVTNGVEAEEDPSSTELAADDSIPLEQTDPAEVRHESPESSKKKDAEEEDLLEKIEEEQAGSDIAVGDLEITPVSAAIARHLGIDLTPEGRAARNRRGIAVIVHGPPMSGKTNTSVALAKTYGAARLTIDGVVLDAISSGSTQAGRAARDFLENPRATSTVSSRQFGTRESWQRVTTKPSKGGLRARELCAQTAKTLREEDGDGTAGGGVGLSVEAVTAHTGTGPSIAGTESKMGGGASVISTKKTSVISKQAASVVAASKVGGATASENTGSQVPSSPPLLAAPIGRRLSVSASVAGEEGLVSCILPEDLLVEILAERLQLNDCHQGVIFDGLGTMFSNSAQATTVALLKAINNRKHIYFVTLKLDYPLLKKRQQAKEEETAKTEMEKRGPKQLVLEDMDEDEYDALPEHQKQEIEEKVLAAKRLRRKKEVDEKLERERIERERLAILEEKRLEEESKKNRGKKGKREETAKRSISGKHGDQGGQQAPPAKEKGPMLKVVLSQAVLGQSSSHDIMDRTRPDSRSTEKPDSIPDESRKGKKPKGRPTSGDDHRDDDGKRERSETERMLQKRFKAFEQALPQVSFVLDSWDRTILMVNRPVTPDNDPSQNDDDANMSTARDKPPPSGKRGTKKEKEKDRLERERAEKERMEKEKAERERMERERAEREKQRIEEGELPEDLVADKSVEEELNVPHIQLDANDIEAQYSDKLFALDILPTINEILDGLGLGPDGPPIPPPATFSVIPYPVKRRAPVADPPGHYDFVASSPDDPNVVVEDQGSKDQEISQTEEATPSETTRADSKKDELQPPSSRRSKKDRLESNRPTTSRKPSPRRSRRGSNDGKSSPPPFTPASEADQSSTIGEVAEFKTLKLSHFRWMVPAHSECVIRIRFLSDELGQFDQTLDFEITGTRRRYQLFCRGVCAFPTISREPRIVFPHRRKTKLRHDDIISKKYLLQEEVFEFGPLLCGKTRERYKEGKYPENMEKLTVMNTSPLPASISFCYQHDSNASTFLLDPPNMMLEPNESKLLSIWAYPKSSGRFLDTLVCCVRENPEPICFSVACHGVRPEIEIDRKHLHFDKVLLHRKDTRMLYLRNSGMLPVAWRIAGMENMGDDFSLNQDSGIIEPRCEFPLQLHFRATKAVNVKKIVRLEVSDVENIMGLVQTENIQVTAEAYDVALDMSFPKGADGGLDFGTIRVMDESKQTCSLKNKGKYEIGFNFLFERHAPNCPPVDELFCVLPQKGTLIPNDRPTQVQVIFRSRCEVSIRDLPLLKCQVIEPNIGDGREVIASIPIKLSVRSLFSKYTIYPHTDINFGPMILNSRKSRTFTVENKGEFDFKYTVAKMIREAPTVKPRPMVLGGKRAKSRDGSSSSRSVARGGRAASLRQDVGSNQTRLLIGPFTVYPGFGTILPGGVQNISVDSVAENLGRSEEFLSIDISDRDPNDNSSGIPYRLLAEGCIPSINTTDITSIFEEHRICKNLNVYLQNKEMMEECGGVFGEEDNRFMFSNVIVGRKAYARFKISNTNKVPVDVSISVKPVSNKVAARIHDIFEVEVPKGQIQPHHFMYATVTFCPPAMSNYVCYFEAAVDGVPTNVAKGRSLLFEVCGEGNLPRVTVAKPVVRNRTGEPVFVFQRLVLGRDESLPLVLRNEGTLPCKVNITMEQQVIKDDDDNLDFVDENTEFSAYASDFAYNLTPASGTKTLVPVAVPGQASRLPYTASVILEHDEEAVFDVTFMPMTSRVYNGQILISTVDNQFEEHRIQLYGEGFKDDVTIDNLLVPGDMATLAEDDGVIDTDMLVQQLTIDPANGGSGVRGETLMFGDCDVSVAKDRIFTLANHSTSDAVRFQWNEHSNVTFVPMLGHLHPGCSKDITVTFKSDEPVEMKKSVVKCSVSKISFNKPMDQITDWDDRMRIVKWVDVDQSQDSKRTGHRPAKKKVVETETEPDHVTLEGSSRILDLLVTATVAHAQYSCDASVINFKDTLMLQTRVFEFTVENTGKVLLHYNWKVVMEALSVPATASGSTDAAQSLSPGSQSVRSGAESSIPSLVIDDESAFSFSISPPDGKIKVGGQQSFTVRFSPHEVTEYQARLLCSINNLESGQQGPVIKLRGRSLMPYCHFDLESSDYISSSRRNQSFEGAGGAPGGSSLDPNTRVIEFHSIGVNVRNYKKFWIMNPTSSSYSFQWICDDVTDARVPPSFTCHVTEGQLSSGKKLEISFEYQPRSLSVCESLWRFVILDQNISIPFLLVGFPHEPQISLSASHINFKSLLVGRTATETVYIVNSETIGFNYQVVDSSCHSEGYSSSVSITPEKGFVPPNSKLPLLVSYTAKSPGDANFNAEISIARKTKNLTLNIKASGHSVAAQLFCENSLGVKVELSPVGLNAINLGEVELHEKAARQLHLVNNGKYNFEFEWIVKYKGKVLPSSESSKSRKRAVVSVSPDDGSVPPGTRKRSMLIFQPTKLGPLASTELMLKISDGPTYLCHVNGSGVNPGVDFSFDRHDFGACFVYKAGMPLNTKTLRMINKDNKDVSVECLYESSSHLDVSFSASVISPGACAEALFTFFPRETTSYRDIVSFHINGLSTRDILIMGEGTELRVEVANPKQKIVKFGALRIGQASKHLVPIVNRSPTPITLTISVTPESQPLQTPGVLRVLPTESITLQPKGGSKDVEVYFSPKSRVPQFTEEVTMECAGMFQPLFIVTGSCQGTEVTLDQDSIPFGAVVQKSQSERRFTMQNLGDIGAGFRWEDRKFSPDFSISPIQGYISPGMEVPFTVVFHPKELSPDIRYEDLRCFIEGGKTLKLTLTGMCVTTPPSKEVLNFVCHVRGREVRSVTVSNRSNQRWVLQPVIDGEYWSGADTFVLEAQQSKPYDLVYRPVTMTTDGKKHQGSVFFPLPDGSGLLYNLQGQSDPPKPVASVNRDVPCKTAYVELLSVANWLKKPQRFRVVVEMIKPDKLDAGTTMKGLDYIDVPGSVKRDYKLNFFAHKEGSFGAKVIFKNDRTGEYIFYYVTLRATSPGVMGTIELETPVRKSVLHTLRIENPLSYALTFQIECKVPDINLPPQFTVPSNSEGTFTFEYQPLKAGEVNGKLILTNNDLGSYTYDLVLKATPAGQEKTTFFKCGLGSSQAQTIKFQNYARQKTDYICKIESPEFNCERSFTAAPASSGNGTEVTIDVTYEPMRLGECRSTLSVTSSVGGEYSFPLQGHCVPPKPQGPYVVRNKSNASIPFKNIFPATTVFAFQVDNPHFSVKPGEAIRSKKTHNISVAFESNAAPGTVVTGKMTLSCVRSAGMETTSWVFYLKGIIPDHNAV